VNESNENKHSSEENREHEVYRVRLPGFLVEEDVGLGDIIKRATSAVGLEPCDGCAQRAAMLNRWLIFTSKRHE
jgi:hypothetical protein